MTMHIIMRMARQDALRDASGSGVTVKCLNATPIAVPGSTDVSLRRGRECRRLRFPTWRPVFLAECFWGE